jgi:hypothetical protein
LRGSVAFGFGCAALLAAAEPDFQPLFNGRDLDGWDTWLGPRSSGYHDPATSNEPAIGLNRDPLGVFTVVTHDGAPAIRISGEVFGAITTRREFGDVHIRVEYKWGRKKWPPRHEAKHYRDSGILYWCVGRHGAGSGAWMRSIECNIMEKGGGQWWSVAGSTCDVEGRRVVLDREPAVPYRGESPGEAVILWEPGGPVLRGVAEGVTSPLDPERPGEWNVCEVFAWGHAALHVLNGQVVLALTNPRYREAGRDVRLERGRIQIQSEGAEIFYRRLEARPLTGIPPALMPHVPAEARDESGFQPLFGQDAGDGWAQCGPGGFTLSNGVATAYDGMGLWWHTNRMFTNFVLRGEWRLEAPDADSGVFVRFPDPGNDPWNAVKHGHEMEIGDDPAGQDPAWRTGALYPFRPPRHVRLRPAGEWNEYEFTCIGHHYAIRINGELVTTWTDPQRRTTHGYIGLQNYQAGKNSQHRRLRIKELP